MSEKIYLSDRKWLNPKNSYDSGAIQYSVSSDFGYVEATLDIWDCSKKIGLTFSFENEDSAKLRLEKINILLSSLEDMKKAMGEAYPDIFDKDVSEVTEYE